MKNVAKMEDYLSIGELSKLSGVGIHSLRVWEKRYGAPISKRLPSGHRRYPKDEVPRLRAITRALESGYRASKVVTRTLEELQGLLSVQNLIEDKPEQPDLTSGQVSRELTIEKWIKAIHQYDDELLNQNFFELWNKEGPLTFITDYVTPFIERVGNGWADKELSIAHEHFVTEILSDFLSSKWRNLNIRKEGKTAVLAALPDETHSLGLLMCAVVTSMADFKVVYLGINSPIEEIIKTTENSQAQLVCLSISSCVDPIDTEYHLKKIRQNLSKEICMVTGGLGAVDAVPEIHRLNSFRKYYDWITQLNILSN